MTKQVLASMIDQTLLKPDANYVQLRKHCEVAVIYGFKTVAVNNAVISFCRKILEGTGVLCDAAVSFPLGQSTVETKVFETLDAVKNGAGEVDYVVNLVEVENGNWDYVKDEMSRIVLACKANNVTSKVIFENCYLTEEEKKKLCDIALKVQPDFIKTSTGFGAGGATLEDVQLMKKCVGNNVKIKAAGGIRSLEMAMAMIDAGADRIGTSRGVEILEEFLKLKSEI